MRLHASPTESEAQLRLGLAQADKFPTERMALDLSDMPAARRYGVLDRVLKRRS